MANRIDEITSEEFGQEYLRELNTTQRLIYKSGDEVDVEYAKSVYQSRFKNREVEVVDGLFSLLQQVKGTDFYSSYNYLESDLCNSVYSSSGNNKSRSSVIINDSEFRLRYATIRWEQKYPIISAMKAGGITLTAALYFYVVNKVKELGLNFAAVGFDEFYTTMGDTLGDNGVWSVKSLSLADQFTSFSFHKAACNLGLFVTTKNSKRKSKSADYLQNVGAFYNFVTKDVMYIVRRPCATYFSNNRFHNDQGPALKWRDGSKVYVLHGMYFEEELYWKTVNQELTLQEVNDIRNSDQRAIVWRMMDPKELLDTSKAKLIHTGVKGTDLYKISHMPLTGRVGYCMLMTCPSTQRQFLEWVNPDIGMSKDADQCQANAWGVTKEQYLSMVAEG